MDFCPPLVSEGIVGDLGVGLAESWVGALRLGFTGYQGFRNLCLRCFRLELYGNYRAYVYRII